MDANGRLRLNDKLGYAKRVQRYDDRNRLVEEEYFGPDGAPMLYQKQYARLTYVYDQDGQCIAVILWDAERKQIPAARVTVVAVTPDSQAERIGLQLVRARAKDGKTQELHVQRGTRV